MSTLLRFVRHFEPGFSMLLHKLAKLMFLCVLGLVSPGLGSGGVITSYYYWKEMWLEVLSNVWLAFLLPCIRHQHAGRTCCCGWRLPDVRRLPDFKQSQNFHHIFRAQLPSLPPQPAFPPSLLPFPWLRLWLWVLSVPTAQALGFCWLWTFLYVKAFCNIRSTNGSKGRASF